MDTKLLPPGDPAALEVPPPGDLPLSERQRLAEAAQVLLHLPEAAGEIPLDPSQVQAIRALARDYRLLLGLSEGQKLPVCLFFGVWSTDPRDNSHSLYLRSGRSIYLGSQEAAGLKLPTLARPLDGGYAPGTDELKRTPDRRGQPQGLVRTTHEAGWTIFSFWDQTGRQQYGSNAAFLLEGTWTFEDLAPVASRAFPRQWARFGAGLRQESPEAWRLLELGAE